MDLSVFLAQLMGLYLLITGIIFLLRQESLIPVVKGAGSKRFVILVLALAELAAGLMITIAHPIYTFDWKGIISFIGLWMVIESVFFLIIPTKLSKKVLDFVSNPVLFSGGGLIAIVFGAYLAAVGFGII